MRLFVLMKSSLRADNCQISSQEAEQRIIINLKMEKFYDYILLSAKANNADTQHYNGTRSTYLLEQYQ